MVLRVDNWRRIWIYQTKILMVNKISKEFKLYNIIIYRYSVVNLKYFSWNLGIFRYILNLKFPLHLISDSYNRSIFKYTVIKTNFYAVLNAQSDSINLKKLYCNILNYYLIINTWQSVVSKKVNEFMNFVFKLLPTYYLPLSEILSAVAWR